MNEPRAEFVLRRNPDVLTCIANLSNDEVFTPPEFAKKMLHTLAESWSADHDDASIWADPNVTFLDPVTKSGVFLREITRRLIGGLENEIPDLKQRVDHILTKQVYGIGITKLTTYMARRSLYCSKDAASKHSVAQSFRKSKKSDGNIWFARTEHTWVGGTEWDLTVDEYGNQVDNFTNSKCKYCGANRRDYDRGHQLETHAYVLIHADDVNSRLREIFGDNMQFDVIIGNPPYQLGQSGGEAVGSFAMPIYQKFVDAAKALEPRYAVMVIPSRWFAGGRGPDEFRKTMLSDRRIRTLVDYPDSREVFAGVDIAGGIAYFLWDSSWNDTCEVKTVRGGVAEPSMRRYLDEYDILVRYNEEVSILHRVLATPKGHTFASLASRVAPIQPFSIRRLPGTRVDKASDLHAQRTSHGLAGDATPRYFSRYPWHSSDKSVRYRLQSAKHLPWPTTS